MNEITFLNDKNVDGELYGILQSISNYEVIDKSKNDYITFVKKSNMLTQTELCKKLDIKSPKTLRSHLNYLIEHGYLIKNKDKDLDILYYLPEIENIYLLIPHETTKYLKDNCKSHVFKIYIYLAQRYQWALKEGRTYEFTLKELGEHVGLKMGGYTKNYEIINHALELLSNSELISYVSFFDGSMQKKKLTKLSFEYKKSNG